MREIREISPSSRGYALDLSDPEATERVCDKMLADAGGIDVLVSTVGINAKGPAHEWTDEQGRAWHAGMDRGAGGLPDFAGDRRAVGGAEGSVLFLRSPV